MASAELNFCQLKEKKKTEKETKGSKLNLLVSEAAVDIDKGAQCNSNNKLYSLTLYSIFNPFK